VTVAVLIVTHNAIGRELLQTATATLGGCPLPVRLVGVHTGEDPDLLQIQTARLADELDEGDGVLVLTDAYGATPCNVASRLLVRERIVVVSGINLPMLLRVLNYPELDLASLAEKAASGGCDGIVIRRHQAEL
jgi:PTS system ascorbate-specific IIA component